MADVLPTKPKDTRVSKYLVPLLSFAIFLIPLVMDALQIDFEASNSLPPHWQLVSSAIFSGGVSTVLIIFRRIYENYQIDYDKEIADLKNQIKVLALGRDLDEKKLMLTTAQLNDEWLEKNVTIEKCEQLLTVLKSKTERIKEQQAILETVEEDANKALESSLEEINEKLKALEESKKE